MSTDLQAHNGQSKLAEWAGKISACRNSGMTVTAWCKENGVCEQTYYKWQRRLFVMAQAQQAVQFAEVIPAQPVRCSNVAVTVRLAGAEADILSYLNSRKHVLAIVCRFWLGAIRQPPVDF